MSKTKPYYYCNIVGNTDIGCKRQTNEDWLDSFECENGLVAVVCDGMGGHVGGQVASHTAVDAIRDFLLSHYFDNPKDAIIAACNAANQAILQKTMERPELSGMGSTCVMLIVRNGKVYIGSVGDSRVYLIRSKKIHQLTKDQSYVQMLVDLGEISKEQAEHHPRKNEITNALGLPSMQPATVLDTPINPEAGDCFLLCSDGLSGMVSDEEIARVVSSQSTMSQKMRVDSLIERARKHGGLDNITCQIVEFAITPPTEQDKRDMTRKMLTYALSAVAVVALGLGGYFLYKHVINPPEPDPVQTNNEINVLNEIPNSKVTRYDTLFYTAGKKILEIEENKGYDALTIYVYSKDKDSITNKRIIKMPLALASMRIMPADTSFLSIKQDSLNANKRILSFGKECKGKELSLRFDYNDSTYIYAFPVVNPSAGNVISFNDPPLGKNHKSKGSLEVTLDDTIATISLGKGVKEQKVFLTSKREYRNVNNFSADTIYIQYAMKADEKKESWHSYKSDGRDCHITIIADKVPAKHPEIKIPLNNTDKEYFVIKIKK